MTDHEKLIWAAGLFDGEGCVSTTNSNMIRVGLEMTFEAAVREFHSIAGCGCFLARKWRDNRAKRYKRQYSLTLQGKDAYNFMKKLLPYLLVKREQAELVIQWGETCIEELQYSSRGRLPLSPEVQERRYSIKRRLQELNKQGDYLSKEEENSLLFIMESV